MKQQMFFGGLLFFFSVHLWAEKSTIHSTTWKKCGALCKKKLHRLPPLKLQKLLRTLQKVATYSERVAILSQMLLRAPYRLGPLGEGSSGKWDKDPLFRLDVFDCLTYIESVMALASSSSLQEAIRKAQFVRYKHGKIGFGTRNHFGYAQWLKENQKKGWLRENTREIASPWVLEKERIVTPQTWEKGKWLRRMSRYELPSSFRYTYVPFEHVSKIQHRLPLLSWAGLVSREPQGAIVLKHVGLLVWIRGVPYFRHASHKVNVIQFPLWKYIKRVQRRNRNKTPFKQMIGFVLAEMKEPLVVSEQEQKKIPQTLQKEAYLHIQTHWKKE